MTNEFEELDEEGIAEEPSATPDTVFVVAPEQVGERLDRFVVAALPELSRSFISQLVRNGHILVQSKPAKPSQQLRVNEIVNVQLPTPQPSELVPEDLPLEIVYEDADIVVVNKAAGMVVHPSAGHASGTLVNALLFRYPDMLVGSDLRPGIVHRIDRDTSGLLVVVRNDRARRFITEQQQARTMRKAYLAVVEGRMKEPEGVIDASLSRHPIDRLRQAVVTNGRFARTHYRVLEELGDYTLIEAVLETGRTHQIRVHFAHIQRPVVGDPLYGPRKPHASFGLRRQFLHAYELGFLLPSTGTWQQWSSPLPSDLQAALTKIRNAAG